MTKHNNDDRIHIQIRDTAIFCDVNESNISFKNIIESFITEL